MLVYTLCYLSLFSWTGNNPPRMTSPLIRAPLGARLSTTKDASQSKKFFCGKVKIIKCKIRFQIQSGIEYICILNCCIQWLCCIFSWKNANQPDKGFAQVICSLHFSSVDAKKGSSPKSKTSAELFIHFILSSNFTRLRIHFDGSLYHFRPITRNECSLWKLQTIKWIINNEKLLILRNPARPWKKSPATGKLFPHFK